MGRQWVGLKVGGEGGVKVGVALPIARGTREVGHYIFRRRKLGKQFP